MNAGDSHPDSGGADAAYDAVVIGAGFAGLYMLYQLRDVLGLSVRGFEKASDVGGTWYWNRYPGARCDSKSHVYCYSFSEEILEEWEWSEQYPERDEIYEYLQFVADHFSLREDIAFETEVTSATFDEETGRWQIRTHDGSTVSSQFLVTAVGSLSEPFIPDFDGLDTFEGDWYHTARWPAETVDLTGKRVGLIGTGSSGIQIMPKLAERAAHLTVFQRTPNYGVPSRNRPLEPGEFDRIRDRYDEIWEESHNSARGRPSEYRFTSVAEADEEAINRALEASWDEGGRLNVFRDTLTHKATNERVSEFLRSKIRSLVDDPALAEKLAPTDHPYGTKRPPRTYYGYYDKYNRDDVVLKDVDEAPIERITKTGIRTTDSHHDLDIIVFATGFDALTGALMGLNLTGRDGMTLAEAWADGPRTYFGLTVPGFPNLFTITGPQSPSVLANMPVAIEQHVEWISDCIEYMRSAGLSFIEPQEAATAQWVEYNNSVADNKLYSEAESWYLGDNIPGKPKTFLVFSGGLDTYNDKLATVTENGYEGFALSNSLDDIAKLVDSDDLCASGFEK